MTSRLNSTPSMTIRPGLELSIRATIALPLDRSRWRRLAFRRPPLGRGTAEQPHPEQQGVGLRGFERLRQQVPLAQLAAELEEASALLGPFDSLRHDPQAEDVREVDDRAQQRGLLF